MEKIKVLCAEDDELSRVEIKEKMEEKGWEVIEATDGMEALELYQQHNPDLIILDLDMPRRTGLEVLQLIRVNDWEIPIIVYSAMADEGSLRAVLKSGTNNYILKIYSVDYLVEMVESLINKENTDIITLAEGVVYHISKAELQVGEECYKLTIMEGKVFSVLCKNKNKLSRLELLKEAGWGNVEYKTSLQLNKVISKFRKLLEKTDKVDIVSDKGNGYWLKIK